MVMAYSPRLFVLPSKRLAIEWPKHLNTMIVSPGWRILGSIINCPTVGSPDFTVTFSRDTLRSLERDKNLIGLIFHHPRDDSMVVLEHNEYVYGFHE